MAKEIFDFVDHGGSNVVEAWLTSLDVDLRARMALKIKVLATTDSKLPSKMLTNTKDRNIQELIVNGRKALRLFVCAGPIRMRPEVEFTLLFGAEERDRKYEPRDALARAAQNRELVLINAQTYRVRRRV